MLRISRRGFPETARLMTELMPEKMLVRVIRDVTSRMTRFAASINPVDTGAMRDSWTWTALGLTGQAYISLSSFNPRSGVQVIEYAPYVDERVGLVDAVLLEGGRIAVEALEAAYWLL